MTIEESGSCRMIDMDSSSDTANSDANTYGTAMDPKHIKCEQDDDNHDDQSRDFSPQKGRYHRYVSLKSKPHFSDSMIELDVMKTTIHDKGNQLSSVWNELYGLLGDYQAKLFSKEGDFLASKSKYDSVNDLDQLRNDLIGKDEEVKELMDRLQAIESRSETVQLDLSVKNSLLKKYQQDLLDKEAALLSLQSANKKLENRVQVLEAKLSADNRGTDNRVTDNHGSVLSRPLSERCSAMSLQRPSSSGLLRHTPPSLKRRGLPSSSIMHSIQKRRSQPPPAQAKAPMVCIEVEDEEDLNEINMSLTDAQVKTEPNVNAPLYIDAWSEGQQDNCEGRAETEATPLSSLPGDYTTHREGQYSQMSGQSADDSGQEQGDMKWQVPLQDGGMDTSLLGPGLDGSSQKSGQLSVFDGLVNTSSTNRAPTKSWHPRVQQDQHKLGKPVHRSRKRHRRPLYPGQSPAAEPINLTDAQHSLTDTESFAHALLLKSEANSVIDASVNGGMFHSLCESPGELMPSNEEVLMGVSAQNEALSATGEGSGLSFNPKKFQCKSCSSTFESNMALYEHTLNQHRHTLYECTQPGCNKAYTRQYALAQHLEAHSGRVFRCPACAKAFPLRRGYYQHVTQFCQAAKLMNISANTLPSGVEFWQGSSS